MTRPAHLRVLPDLAHFLFLSILFGKVRHLQTQVALHPGLVTGQDVQQQQQHKQNTDAYSALKQHNTDLRRQRPHCLQDLLKLLGFGRQSDPGEGDFPPLPGLLAVWSASFRPRKGLQIALILCWRKKKRKKKKTFAASSDYGHSLDNIFFLPTVPLMSPVPPDTNLLGRRRKSLNVYGRSMAGSSVCKTIRCAFVKDKIKHA